MKLGKETRRDWEKAGKKNFFRFSLGPGFSRLASQLHALVTSRELVTVDASILIIDK